ncbi:glycosyl hydrolase 108 family protein [Pyruvatibacter sp.]|uniref:glycoside hydrolase family 108 protein n=1 Tax=Pyruvatibacter sp. TaxID=1981328 RepID=UPI0032EFC764
MTPDTKFDAAIETVLRHEGGYVNDPVDPGGATNWGISLRFLLSLGRLDADGDGRHDFDFDMDGDVDPADMKLLPRADAIALYKKYWWDKFSYGDMPELTGAKLFDLSVNMGARQAHRLLQRALRANGQRSLEDDGLIGRHTLQALNAVAKYSAQGDYAATVALRSEAAGFYRGLIICRPVFKKYEGGWLRRAYA